jgi:hypothetical protein
MGTRFTPWVQKDTWRGGVFEDMTNMKITAAAFIASLAIGAATTTTAQAKGISATPTGNSKQDTYCKGAADLVNDAYENAGSSTNNQDAAEWYDLGQEFQARAEQNGCTFKASIKRRATKSVSKSATAAKAKRA